MKRVSEANQSSLSERQQIGQVGEDQALRYLLTQQLILVERNFRCRCGEIDLIMWHGKTLVFVEVRKRAGMRYGGAAASINWQKQAKLLTAAQFFLQRYRSPPPCRFDAIAIDGDTLNWMRNIIET